MSDLPSLTIGNKVPGYSFETPGLDGNPAAIRKADAELTESIMKFLNVSDDPLKPALAPPLRGGLSIESLAEALGNEERKIALETGLSTLEERKKSIKENLEKKLKEIKERLEKAEKKTTVSTFMKIFKWIGLIVGAVAAVATTIMGAVTANPVLIAAGVMMTVMAVNSIVSEATDGEISIAAGISKGLQALGVKESIANIVGQVFTVAVMLTAAVMTFGVGFLGWGGGMAATTTTTIGTILANTGKIASLVGSGLGALNSIASGAVSIYGAVLDKDIADSFANTKELEAILQKIQAAMEVEKNFMDFILKKCQAITEKVMDLIQDSSKAQTEILAGGDAFSSPSMA